MATAQDFDCALVRGFLGDPDHDWFVLERKEHDGREWQVATPYGTAYCYSARLEPFSTIEGCGQEWLEIADAIESGGSSVSKRCAAERTEHGYLFSSPRNTEPGNEVLMSFGAARRIAEEIRRVVPARPST